MIVSDQFDIENGTVFVYETGAIQLSRDNGSSDFFERDEFDQIAEHLYD